MFRTAVCFTGMILATLLTGCSKPESRVAHGNREQILHVGNYTEPGTLDPALWTSNYEWHVSESLFEPLVYFDAGKGEAIPAAARRWDVSADGRVYTFHLRENGKWSNGDPVTAVDFVWSYRRVLQPKLGAEYVYRFFVIENARDYYEGRVTDLEQLGFKAVDDLTLQITLAEPIPFFLANLFSPYWYPVHRASIEEVGAWDDRSVAWARPGTLVGNGPFVLREWKVNEVIRVERNPHYWNHQNVRLNAINLYPIESLPAEERAFRSGQLHVTFGMPSEKVPAYQRESPEQLRLDPALNVYYLPMNTTRPPFNDVRVRRAFSLALNRGQLAERIGGPGYQPAYHFTVPGIAGYTSRAALREDVAEAKQLLAEAGFPDGAGFPAVEFSFNTHDLHKQVAEAAQQMWQKHLNVQVQLVNREFKVHVSALYARDFDIARIGYGAEFADAYAYLSQLISGSKDNFSGWSNPAYDALLKQALAAGDKAAREEFYQQADALIVAEVPILPIFFDAHRYLVQPSVKNWQPDLTGHYPYATAYLQAP